MFGIPLEEVLILGAVLLAGGIATGLLAGLLGIGGGAIIVPVLYYLFGILGVPEDVRMHLSVGTSLAVIIPTTTRSYISHNKRGAVDHKTLRIVAIPVLAGVFAGAALAAVLGGDLLKLAFAAFGLMLGGQMLFLGTSHIQMAKDLPGRAGLSVWAFFISVFAALVGVGGGSLLTLLYTTHGRTIHQGVATGAGIGILISIPGAISFAVAGWPEMARLPPFSLGYVSAIGTLLIAPVSMLIAPIGVRIAHAFTRRQLEMALGVFLVIMGGRFLVELLLRYAG
ncbi:UPF0721 transmembrane protein [Terrihabitans soli]|uniref:Probable membrane transporter protein n=1 Tax=Terrihabitans soli TaxID=708113 RepID=A0A6S6QQR4_9HYPH|nr:sulfite exporter TauE/SafE family protein [Terrihabitans soli]BCJ90307.1 UPF0721 transmembrane protein [Terrihabitans soli]